MKLSKVFPVWLGFLFLLTGCGPQNRIVWAPDGSRFLFIASDGLHMGDASGKLSQILMKDVDRVAWLRDSRQALVAVHHPIASWKEVSALLSNQERKAVETTAVEMEKQIMAYQGHDWDKFFKAFGQGKEDLPFATEILFYVKTHATAALISKLGSDWKMFDDTKPESHSLYLCDIGADEVKQGKSLFTALGDIQNIRVSPKANCALVAEDDQARAGSVLRLVFFDGAESRFLVDSCAEAPDWTPDGHSVFFIRRTDRSAIKGSNYQLGTLSKLDVCTADGQVMEKIGDPCDLALTLAFAKAKIRCIDNDRVLFSAVEAELPSTIGDVRSTANLFLCRVKDGGLLSRVIPRGAENVVGDQINDFELSPDGKFVSLPDHSGKVAVLDLVESKVSVVQDVPDRDFKDLRFIPSWRAPAQLTFAAPVDGTSRHTAEVVVFNLSDLTKTTLSEKWPDTACNDILFSGQNKRTEQAKEALR